VVFSNSGVVVYQHTEAHRPQEIAMQTQTTPAARNANAALVRPFGLGYGRSSSYGAPRSYSSAPSPARFRVA